MLIKARERRNKKKLTHTRETNKQRGIGDSVRRGEKSINMAMNLEVKLKHVYDLTFAQMAEFESVRVSKQASEQVMWIGGFAPSQCGNLHRTHTHIRAYREDDEEAAAILQAIQLLFIIYHLNEPIVGNVENDFCFSIGISFSIFRSLSPSFLLRSVCYFDFIPPKRMSIEPCMHKQIVKSEETEKKERERERLNMFMCLSNAQTHIQTQTTKSSIDYSNEIL